IVREESVHFPPSTVQKRGHLRWCNEEIVEPRTNPLIETDADPDLPGHSAATTILALILEMRAFVGFMRIERLRQEDGVAARDAVKLFQQSLRARLAAEEPKVVAEHDDDVERVGRKLSDVLKRKEARPVYAHRLRRLHCERRIVDAGDIEALSLGVEGQ